MAQFPEKVKITKAFSEAIGFSKAKLALQMVVPSTVEDEELTDLRTHLESCGFTISRSPKDISDLEFDLECTEKRLCGLIVTRKKAISIDLLNATFSFLESRSDSQILIVNGCNAIDDEPDEEVSDFWICLIQGGGCFYAEDDEPIRLFQRSRNEA